MNPFAGIYSATKHAVEAIAQTMALELQEFGIEVATVNPGPFLTGFNDHEGWKLGMEEVAYQLIWELSCEGRGKPTHTTLLPRYFCHLCER